ncbi:hypothetical protein ACO0LL_13825 [Undibacterium sp. TC4M20W]|uniref:hypothetical protein n=1 Tax=Undibacterium sp. TC4M20W TaxID=3413052 RepID=UPI003BF3A428
MAQAFWVVVFVYQFAFFFCVVGVVPLGTHAAVGVAAGGVVAVFVAVAAFQGGYALFLDEMRCDHKVDHVKGADLDDVCVLQDSEKKLTIILHIICLEENLLISILEVRIKLRGGGKRSVLTFIHFQPGGRLRAANCPPYAGWSLRHADPAECKSHRMTTQLSMIISSPVSPQVSQIARLRSTTSPK